MPTFVLEIGTEEMPARFLPGLMAEIEALASKLLAEAKIDVAGIASLATPRRIALTVSGMATDQRSEEEVLTGPPVKIAYGADGSLTKAGEGFARSQNLPVESLFRLTTDKGEYLAARRQTGGGRTIDCLPGICERLVSGLSFPKKMHWGSGAFTFGRPIRWLLALFGAELVPFTVEGLASGRLTHGHRVMGPGPFEVAEAEAYAAILTDQAKVCPSPAERRAKVLEQGDAAAKAKGGTVVWDEGLLGEVVNLVEYPRPILGDFNPSYLALPREVLLTSMQSHQKSFGVEGPDGRLLPHFLCTLNLDPEDLALVKKGWERVLKARLEDARFFWEADLAASAENWLSELENVTFIGPIGSMGDKSRRLEQLCGALAATIEPKLKAEMKRAGRLAKADLVSEMVYEFDTLQGMMGGIYARRRGEPEAVAQALYEQYLPAGPDSPVPATLPGAILALADKADTLAGCFGLGMIPTGAADPYALRRQVLGICRIIMDKKLRLPLTELLAAAQSGYGQVKWKLQPPQALEKLQEFFGQRLRALFTGQGVETRIVDAAIGAGYEDVWALKARIEALAAFSKEADFEQAVLTFKRAANIIRKQAGEAGVTLTGSYDAALLKQDEEKALAKQLADSAPRFEALWKADDFPTLLSVLRELRPFVDAFFDKVMVMSEDVAERENRLNLLAALVGRLGRLADFGALQV